MASIYEYLFTAVIIVVMLVASSTMVTTLSAPSTSESEKAQLQVTSEKIMTQFLLDPGAPYEWGINNILPDDLRVFGLAKYGATSRQAYCLDPDKVMRLTTAAQAPPNSFIPPGIVLNLTNLRKDYGFTLELKPALNVTRTRMVNAANPSQYTFTVTVLSGNNLMPVMNAKVTAALYYLETATEINRANPLTGSLVTQFDGKCPIDFGTLNVYNNNEAILVVVVDYYGEHFAKAFSADPDFPVKATSILGTQIMQTTPSQYNIQDSTNTYEVIGVRQVQAYAILNFTVTNQGGPADFSMHNPPEQSMIAVIGISNGHLLYASQDFTLSYKSIQFSDSNQKATGFAYSLERTVLIRDTSYTATLYLWRMSW